MIGIAWPDASQHIFYIYDGGGPGASVLMEEYWSVGVGWNTREIAGPPVLTELSTFIGADGTPHLVYGGGGRPGVESLFDLWWDNGQWNVAQGPDVAFAGALAAYATPDGQNHVVLPVGGENPPGERPLSPQVMYFSWTKTSDAAFNVTFQDSLYDMVRAADAELGGISELGPLAVYANPDGNEWCFFPEAGPDGPNLGQLWAVNINDNAVVSSVEVIHAAGCPPVAQASGLAAYSIWIRGPITLRGVASPGTQHVFFTDADQNIWEAASADGRSYTATNLSQEAGAEPAWYQVPQQPQGVQLASALAGFITLSYPPLRFPVREPYSGPAPTVTQWIFYVGQDDELHYISVDDTQISTESLASVNKKAPDLPPTALDAYTSPDGSWHVNYSGGGSLQEVYWLNDNLWPNTLVQL